jgi:hypothetical protein
MNLFPPAANPAQAQPTAHSAPQPVIWTQQAETAAWAELDAAKFAYDHADNETRPTAWIEYQVVMEKFLKLRRAWYHKGG